MFTKTLLAAALIAAFACPLHGLDGEPNTKKKVVIMLGAPGAGKGSQATRISETFELPHISAGDLYRANIRNNTELGQEAKQYVESGRLAPDSLTIRMILDRVAQDDCAKGYILDGFPRTIPQAEALDEILGDDTEVMAINLDVPDSIITDRITGRIMCQKCGTPYHKTGNPPKVGGHCDRCDGELYQRKDDTVEVVQERLKVYHEQTAPLEDYYAKKGILKQVDATQGMDDVTTALHDLIAAGG